MVFTHYLPTTISLLIWLPSFGFKGTSAGYSGLSTCVKRPELTFSAKEKQGAFFFDLQKGKKMIICNILKTLR
jgi:hypothetical protein